jgi:hypothetical protein
LDKKDKHYIDKNKPENKEKSSEEVLKLEKESYTISLNELKKILDDTKKEYKPSLETGKTKKIEPKGLQNEIKRSFLTKYLSGISFIDIFM